MSKLAIRSSVWMLAFLTSWATVQPQAAEMPGSAPASAPMAAASYQLDATHTFVHWEVLHMGTSTIRGRLDRSSGKVQFDAQKQQLTLAISIDTASVNSGVPILDKLLRGSAMLDAEGHPQAYFTARSARFEGAAVREVTGEFTLRGTSQPLVLKALRWKCGFNPLFRREVCGGDFEAELDRSSFGITHSLPLVADKVRLLIQVEGIKQVDVE
jgi:polyisoprenoid-binding protein YceI